MARKKAADKHLEPEYVADIIQQPITDTIEKNFMPYAMSVIVSRAIPEIDGFKPAHRKLLYTMYKMGLINGQRTKSANVVGQTMKLNPHGDASIYETLVRLTRGNESLLHPFIDSKGSFGKHYSSYMDYAAPRYTEVKLDTFCNEIFRGIDKNAVDFKDNYDNTMKEPVLLPTTFPNILVSPNIGVAVGMACSICSFNLAEICDGTIQLLRNPKTDIEELLDIIRAPDFAGGASLIYSREQIKQIYLTGRGSIKLRSRYVYDKSENCIDILQIPYSTSIELIMKKIASMVKEGKLKEITDFRDEIDLNGFKLTIDLRRGTDPDKLMAKLFKNTPLEDSFDCNFNILVNGTPKQLGLVDILKEWIKFRVDSYRRELIFDVTKKKERLHLLRGLGKVLMDIDKAIKIIRETQVEKDVIPNLQKGFDIDEVQAEYISEIKLRNLNKEYILNKIKEIKSLQSDIEELDKIISSDVRIKTQIAKQLKEIKEKYAKPRKTQLIDEDDIEVYADEGEIENYNVRLVLSKDGYFKKITMLSLRGNDEQKLKDGDEINVQEDAENKSEILFFSDQAQVYKAKVADFDPVKASVLGDYIPVKLGFAEGEKVVTMKSISSYNPEHHMVFVFENGKAVRISVSSYETKANRRKLTNAYSDSSPIVGAFYEDSPIDIMLTSDAGRAIIIKSNLISIKTTRTSQGTQVFTLKKGQKLISATANIDEKYKNDKKYRKSKLPASGVLV